MQLSPLAKIKQRYHAINQKLLNLLGEETALDDSPSNEAKDILTAHNLQFVWSLLDYVTYSEKGYYINKASHGFVLECQPLVGFDESMARNLAAIFQDLLPVGSNLQCLLYADYRVGDILEHWQEGTISKNPMFKKLSENRVKAYSKQALHPSLPLRNFRVILSYSNSGLLESSFEVDKLLILKEQLLGRLEGIYLKGESVKPDRLLEFLHNILYPNNATQKFAAEYNPLDLLAKQALNPGFKWQINDDCIDCIDHDNSTWSIKTYSIKKSPRMWSQNAMQNLIGDSMSDLRQLTCPFLIHYAVHMLPESIKNQKLTKAAHVDKQAHSPMGKYLPELSKQAMEWDFVKYRVEEGDSFLATHYSVTLLSPKDRLLASEQKLLSLYKGNGWELQPDKYIQLLSFLSILPMHWGTGWYKKIREFGRCKTALSYEPANLLPLQGEWGGTQTPGMLFMGRRGQIFYWSPFDSQGNYNVCIVGASGSGKSVFMQDLMTSTLKRNGRVFVLDVGRSFEQTCKISGGVHLTFDAKSSICINPFSTIAKAADLDANEYQEYLDDTLSYLTTIIGAMAAPREGLNDRQAPKLERAIRLAFAKYQQATTITLVAKILLAQDDNRSHELGEMLYPYTKDGSYGRFFEGEANINLTSQLTVVEFEELKNRKDLQTVIVQILMVQITNQMFGGNRETPFNIVLDEAWDMLRGKTTGAFIEAMARKIRKYKGGLIVGTQNVNDFFTSPGAQAAFDNSEWLCMLAQKKESVHALKKSDKFSMNEQEERLLNSIRTVKGQYSEVCIKGAMGHAIGRLKLDPFSLLLYSTAPEDYVAVKHKVNQGLTMEQAIEAVLQDRGVNAAS